MHRRGVIHGAVKGVTQFRNGQRRNRINVIEVVINDGQEDIDVVGDEVGLDAYWGCHEEKGPLKEINRFSRRWDCFGQEVIEVRGKRQDKLLQLREVVSAGFSKEGEIGWQHLHLGVNGGGEDKAEQ